MADRQDARMDAAELYREEVITDRKVGVIRMMVPIRTDGSADPARKTLYAGEAQMLTSMGALPISFDIEADTLAEAVEAYGPAAKAGFDRAVRELQDMRRQAASGLVLPGQGGGGGFAPGGLPGGGKIQIP
jgi:regulator of protease activity HflC (stomatin/prohibitin superfamily)